MAQLHFDGFDMGLLPDWAVVNATSTSVTAFGVGLAASCTIAQTLTLPIPASAEVFVGFRYTAGNASSNTQVLQLFGDAGATEHVRLWWSNSTTLNVGRAATSVATAAILEPVNTWAYIEVRATIADTGGRIVVRVDGATVIDFTGDTKNAGTASTIDKLAFTGGVGTRKFDDFYVNDATGAAPWNTFFGPCRIYALAPTGPGADTQFTPSTAPNWAAVDEQPYSATDYVSGSGVGTRDTYAMADLPANVTSVLGVRPTAVAKSSDGTAVSLKTVTRSGGTVYSGTATALGVSDGVAAAIRSVDPSTGAAWTVAGVNAVESGFEVA